MMLTIKIIYHINNYYPMYLTYTDVNVSYKNHELVKF